MPERSQQPTPVSAIVELPSDFPAIPQSILDRFPDAADWQDRLDTFWQRSNQAIQQAQQQTANYNNSRVTFSVDTFKIYAKNGIPQPMFALDDTGVRIGNVLVINTPDRKVYIGVGTYASDDTPFYIDTDGKFSLGSKLTWDPGTAILTITGTIIATSGSIGGFNIGSDYIRDAANSFGLASTITGGDDVRFWAGASFASRTTAPFRLYESGAIFSTSGTIGGFTIGATTLTATGITLNAGAASVTFSGPGTGAQVTTSLFQLTRTGVRTMDLIIDTLTFGVAGKQAIFSIDKLSFQASSSDPEVILQLGSTTNSLNLTISSGIAILQFQSDTNLYRSAANTLKTDGALIVGGMTTIFADTNSEAIRIVGRASDDIAQLLGRNNANSAFQGSIEFSPSFTYLNVGSGLTLILTLSATGASIIGSISTSKPTTGAAGSWKLGQYTAGVVAQAGKVRVNIDGADIDLLTA